MYETSEKDLMSYLFLLFKDGKSYSCINTHKVAVTQTLSFLDQSWNKNSPLLTKFMKGLFNLRPNLPRYKFTWDVSKVLKYLKTLFPLNSLDMKHLTLKLCTLLALSTAARAQTLVNLNIKNMTFSSDRVVFYFSSLLKTSKPGKSFSISLERFKDEKICVVRTLQEYIKRTSKNRKCDQLLVSFKTFNKISTSTVARWIKCVMESAGIDISTFKAHSIRGASASAALKSGVSLSNILSTGDWSSSMNFRRFYFRDVDNNNESNSFMNGVLNCV